MPLNDGTQSETRAVLDCHRANGSCEFNVGADRKTGDGVTGFPSDLWSRQSTDIRSSDRVVYLVYGGNNITSPSTCVLAAFS